tara:strand:+ start:531 stop:680 length:150 start_codon:yes stop_codon:yes gene_type:complete
MRVMKGYEIYMRETRKTFAKIAENNTIWEISCVFTLFSISQMGILDACH